MNQRPTTPDDYSIATAPGSKVPAWAVSMLVHTALIIGLVLWVDRSPKGLGEQPDRPVGVAVAHRMADRTVYETPEEVSQQKQQEQSASSAAVATIAAEAPPSAAQPLDIEGLLAAVTDTPMPESGGGASSALEAGTGKGDGPLRDGDGEGPAAETMFFGASGSGRRSVYVFDHSDSMEGKPLDAVKKELIRSLGLLTPQQSFQIVTYNNRPSFFNAAGFSLLQADDSTKRRAETFVRHVIAEGGTKHYEALRMALRLRPDVIFFLTDANIPQLDSRELAEMRSRCAESSTTIHAIEFGREPLVPENSFLQKLASQNGGEYRYLNVNAL